MKNYLIQNLNQVKPRFSELELSIQLHNENQKPHFTWT